MTFSPELIKQDYPKPNPGKPNSEWFVPTRNQCFLCKTFGRKTVYKNIFQLYYHFSYHHSKEDQNNGEQEQWRARIEVLLTEVRKQK